MILMTDRTAMITAILTSITIVVLPALKLLYHLNYPTILSFPWTTSTSARQQKKDKQTTVVFAGSFNPPHNGHLVMIQYLAMRYKEAIIIIGVNPNKNYAVSPQKRADILRKMVDTLELGQDCKVRIEGRFDFVPGHLNFMESDCYHHYSYIYFDLCNSCDRVHMEACNGKWCQNTISWNKDMGGRWP